MLVGLLGTMLVFTMPWVLLILALLYLLRPTRQEVPANSLCVAHSEADIERAVQAGKVVRLHDRTNQ